jgi:DDE superfamily endonuclease
MQVKIPETDDEWISHQHEFNLAGLTSCAASMDATYIAIEKCSHSRWNHHKGPKKHTPTWSYNVCINHRGRIICSTKGYPGR